MITISGAEYHLAGPGSLAHGARPVDLADIAHHLSLINRFTGATTRPYSVAEHSLLCSEIAKRTGGSVHLQLAMLLHDAHEAYTTDLSSPAKIAVNCYSMGAGGISAWGAFEDEHARTVRKHFNVVTAFTSYKHQIRAIDLIALATERRDLTAYHKATSSPWGILGDGRPDFVPAADWVDLASPEREAVTWKQWREAFLSRYFEIRSEMDLAENSVVKAAGLVA